MLRKTGSIFVHLDWHASHYVKVELDKIFGYDNFRNEIIWKRKTGRGETQHKSSEFGVSTDSILFYSKTDDYVFKSQYSFVQKGYDDYIKKFYRHFDEHGRQYRIADLSSPSPRPNLMYEYKGYKPPKKGWAISIEKMRKWDQEGRLEFPSSKDGRIQRRRFLDELKGFPIQNLWDDIGPVSSQSGERIGYPTQKPEALIKRIIETASNVGDVVADFFVGGGTTPVVAQKTGRRWIACDSSRIAVSITLDRLMGSLDSQPKDVQTSLASTPDVTLEYWGNYEIPALTQLTQKDFAYFIISAYNGRVATGSRFIHGFKSGTPLFVGPASQEIPVKKGDVIEFAREITTKRGLRKGDMIAWAFSPAAQEVASRLNAATGVDVELVRLKLVRIDSQDFREHVTSKHKEYERLLTFILPPEIRFNQKRLHSLKYEFDIGESISVNPGGKIANVQWDFDFKGTFVSTPGYSFLRGADNSPVLKVQYEFDHAGKQSIACRVQDDLGGEKTHVEVVAVQ